jgi:cytochrome c-type biogenesis protein
MTALIAGAFAAGMVATVNPCGFAMLPAYLGWFLGDERVGRRRALFVGLTVSSGFVLVFVLAGVLVTAGLRAVIDWIPWVALAIGVGLVILGLAQLRGRYVYVRLPGLSRSSRDSSAAGLVGFGASYGAASLSCTLPIFLSLIAGAVASASFIESVLAFVAYGAGMSLVVVVLTLAVAAGRDAIVQRIRPLAAHLGTISGWILLIAGAFIVWYWATVLASGATALSSNPIVGVVDHFTAAAAGFFSANPVLALVLFVVLGVVARWWMRRGREDDDSDDDVKVAASEHEAGS